MSTGLFLDGIFNENYASPSKIKLVFTEWVDNKAVPVSMCGLLASEPTISTSNKWGPIIQNIENLNTVSSAMGLQSMFSWVGASVMCWKGTNPVSFSLDFYLINYKRDLFLERKLETLTKLTALAQITTNSTVSKFTVAVHGGYSANKILVDNKDMFSSGTFVAKELQGKANWGNTVNNTVTNGGGLLFAGSDNNDGTLGIQIGRKLSISKLLVSRIDVTPSVAEVENGKALWYRVNMTVTGYRPLLTTDVDGMYTKNIK